MAEHDKILFIIGAGASAASAHDKVLNLLKDPPLANDMGQVLLSVIKILDESISGSIPDDKFQQLGLDENEWNSWKAFRHTISSELQHFNDDYFRRSNIELQ